MQNLNYDWRKHASQVVSDDNQVERAFMDQAYQFLANKGGALMKDPYRLGFEIVHKNDTNTRMVGIFAFRVGDNLYYVPVFFLNGEIKGTDLLYRHDSKTFVPFEDQWIRFIINKATRDMGTGIAPGGKNRSSKDIDLESIAYPPGTYKSASVAEYASDLMKSASAPGSILKNFILEDGGFQAINTLATLLDSHFKFASEFTSRIPEECWMPSEMADKMHQIKQAEEARKPRPVLVLATGDVSQLGHVPMDKRAAAVEQMSKHGYNLWDDRDSGDAKTTNPVYRTMEEHISEVTEEPGVWDILMQDGSMMEAFVAPINAANVGDNIDGGLHGKPIAPYRCEFGAAPVHVVTSKGDTYNSVTGLFGALKKPQTESIEDLDEKMSKGKAYRIFDAEAGTLSDVIYCTSKSTKAGVDIYKVHSEYGREFTIRRNIDARENSIAGGILGRHSYFIKVNVENREESEHSPGCYSFTIPRPDKHLGSGATLKDWCLDMGVKEASLHSHGYGDFHLRHGFRDQSNILSRVEMAIKMATECRINAVTVEELLDAAEENGSVEFMYGDPETAKSAAMTRLTRDPNFTTSRDARFGVDVEEPQVEVLESETDQDDLVQQRVGDAFDPSGGFGAQFDGNGLPRDVLMSSSPEQLTQLAQSEQVPQIFEHGVVGTLVQTFDSVSMINKYLPDMEQALDKLGRILFLLYWKPRDFEDAYGADDMANLENQILSNFRSFGELVLELLKKSNTRNKGTVSLAGE
jgi:hypothetical protein